MKVWMATMLTKLNQVVFMVMIATRTLVVCICAFFTLVSSFTVPVESALLQATPVSQVENQKIYTDTDQAIRGYLSEVKRNPRIAESHYNLGLAYYKQSALNGAQARKSLKEAIRLKPDYAEAYNALGWTFIYPRIPSSMFLYKDEIRDAQEAIKAFKEAISFNPDCAEAYVGLGKASRMLGNYKESIAALKKAISLERDYVYYDQLSTSYARNGEINDAIEAKKEAIHLRLQCAHKTEIDIYLPTEPDDLPFSWVILGNLLYKASRYSEAIEAYKQGLVLAPGEAALHHHLGLAYFANGNNDLAYNEYLFLVSQYEDLNNPDRDHYQRSADDLYKRIQ